MAVVAQIFALERNRHEFQLAEILRGTIDSNGTLLTKVIMLKRLWKDLLLAEKLMLTLLSLDNENPVFINRLTSDEP